MAKKCPFFPPCGAKSWGSGGAPPTNLILLRNQLAIGRARARRRGSRPRAPDGPPAPPPGPPAPLPGPLPGPHGGRLVGWLVVGVGVGRDWVLRRGYAVSQSAAQRREALNSDRFALCVLPSVVCPRCASPGGSRYRSHLLRDADRHRLLAIAHGTPMFPHSQCDVASFIRVFASRRSSLRCGLSLMLIVLRS